jgi:hypothetical protein
MHQVEKEDGITVLKDSLGENCPKIKIIPTTDVEIHFLSSYSPQKSLMTLCLLSPNI